MKDKHPAIYNILKFLVHVLLACISLLVVVALISVSLRLITKHNKTIAVPDMMGLKIDDAYFVAMESGVRLSISDSVYIRRMKKGTVYSQNPAPGSEVKKGRRIFVTINAVMSQKVTMPNLVGYSMRQAKAELVSRNLILNKLSYINDIATNNVLRQLHQGREIMPGTPIETGSEIELVVGLNQLDDKTFVPSVIGMQYNRAIDMIQDNSLNVNKLYFDRSFKDYNDTLNAIVYRQNPDTSSTSTLKIGSDVALYLTVDESRLPKSENFE